MRRLLLLARLDAEKKRSYGAIATATEHELDVQDKVEAAISWLDTHDPRVVVVDTAVVAAEKLCNKLRSQKKFAQVPLIALTSTESDPMLERLYALGADDVIPAGSGAQLITRLRALPATERLTTPARGLAVVADKDHARCDVLGRVLLNAGYDVKFALDDVALRFYTQKDKARLVVASVDIGPPRQLVEEARSRGSDAAWIVTASRRDLLKHAEALHGMERLTVLASSTSPENVLFTSNELLHTGERPVRAGERALYGTVVHFRAAGGESDELGFSYNISVGGVFVRTLAPPVDERVWIELRPPRLRQRVRLEGRVAWRRPFDPASAAAAPPGFGVAIEYGLGSGLDQFRQQAESFVASTRTGPEAVARLVAETLASQESEASSESNIVISVAPNRPPPRRGPPPLPSPGSAELVPRNLPPPLPAEFDAQRVKNAPPPLPPDAAQVVVPAMPPLPVIAAAPGATRSLLPLLFAVFALIVLVGAAAFVLIGSSFLSRPKSNPASSARTLLPSATPVVVSSGGADLAEAGADGAPSEPSDAASTDLPPVDETDAGPDDKLGPEDAYVVVRSRVAANVYASGYKIGPTNRKNFWKCGLRFIKLAQGEPPRWLTHGQTVDVKCRVTTTIELEPD